MISALSVSRTVLETGPISTNRRFAIGPASTMRVLATFDRACNLAANDGHVAALVLPEVGDGPLNVVLSAGAGIFAGLESGAEARLRDGTLRVGHLEVALDGAATWEPRPDWPGLRQRGAASLGRLADLAILAQALAPEGSLLNLLGEPEVGATGRGARAASDARLAAEVTLNAARRGAEALSAGWQGDPSKLADGATRLAGLGGGLTPAGDDFLAGSMLAAWLYHSSPEAFCGPVLAAAAPRTTMLSAALLRAAATGACSAPWHRLLATLADGGAEQLTAAVGDVLAHGHTSGADALAGFLWMVALSYSGG